MSEEDSAAHQTADELHALQSLIIGLRDQLTVVETEARAAHEEAHLAREEILRLRDQVVAAERDQQELRTSRAKLARLGVRGLVARILNRQ